MMLEKAMISTITAPVANIPADVSNFAAKVNVAHYLGPLADAIGVAFPGRPLRFYLEADPEIADEWRIILEVDVNGWGISELRAGRQKWESIRFDACPPVVACVFCLVLAKP